MAEMAGGKRLPGLLSATVGLWEVLTDPATPPTASTDPANPGGPLQPGVSPPLRRENRCGICAWDGHRRNRQSS